MAKQHTFKDHRTKSNLNNTIPCTCTFRCGSFEYQYEWNWSKKFPKEIADGTVPNIACDSHGNIFAAFRVKGFPIAKFDADGNFIRYYGQHLDIGEIHGIYVDNQDNIWLTDDEFHVIYKLSQTGETLLQLGQKGIASDTGVDMTITSHLKYLTIRRSSGPFNKPTKAVVGPDGNTYVSDGYGNAAVHVFAPNGTLLRSWGNPGNAPGEFNIVHGVFVDKNCRVWIADRDNDRVQVFDDHGNLLKIIDRLTYPADIWANDTNIYVAEMDGRISIFDMEFQPVAQLGYWHSPYKMHSICGDKQGNLYLGLFTDYSIVKLSIVKK